MAISTNATAGTSASAVSPVTASQLFSLTITLSPPRKAIKLPALAKEHWVSLSDVFFPGRREFLRNICQAAGFEPDIVSEVDSLSLLLGAVATGDGVAILPAHAQKLPHAGSTFVPLTAPAPTADLLLVLPIHPASPELATLAALLMNLAARGAE